MRLIDADRLLDRCIFYHLPNGDLVVPIIDVQHAPTVEAPDINVGSMDAISRQEAIEAFETAAKGGASIEDIKLILAEMPSIQPERKRGKWIERESDTEDKENGFKTVIVCSCCDFPATTFYSEDCESRTQIRTDFCPNCGAKMEKR
jgi:hypothetical protein